MMARLFDMSHYLAFIYKFVDQGGINYPLPCPTYSPKLIKTHLPLPTIELSHSTVVVHLPGLQEVRIPLVELIFPSSFPFYLSSSPSNLHNPPFFQSIRREIGSETTDN